MNLAFVKKSKKCVAIHGINHTLSVIWLLFQAQAYDVGVL